MPSSKPAARVREPAAPARPKPGLQPHAAHCPAGPETSVLGHQAPSRPYKSAVQKWFTVGNAKLLQRPDRWRPCSGAASRRSTRPASAPAHARLGSPA
jgi:hypothetical protein